MATIPMDIVKDIFLRLPPKTLVRFRVLAKPYCDLIDSPDFIASHLDRTLRTNRHLMILLRGALHLYSVDLDSLDDVTDVELPMKTGGPTEVFGSCNGLVGLSNSPTDLALFNPSTRQIHQLPVSPVGLPEGSTIRGYVFYGFGYDSVNKDYKVVRMVQFKRDSDDELGHSFPYEVKVYSLKTNSWKRIETVPVMIQFLFYFYYHLLFRRGYGVLAANNLHWVLPPRPGLVVGNSVIVRFDLVSEEFDKVPLPEAIGNYDSDIQMDIGVLDGCLCLICCRDQTYADVWVMKEYGVRVSWTKLFTVQKPKSVKSLAYMRPLVYSEDRNKVLLEINNTKLMWFDLITKKLTTLRIKDCPSSYSAELVVSSLVLGCKGDPNEVKRRQQRQKRDHEDKMRQRKKRDDFLSKGFKLLL
ncbi:PREDICTED: F-box protein CPR30-like [Tarenaya hassleriana]|uniref:F-box protein CPR30-like n=1 Tax=Tarenaya hassleriana TaxID=28532 RepID=UPI00053C2372|nr:PREDICTED: F-box protein CPR30-like [Tarenaya hassleriana]XP_010529480.1 PREDICTED: F-box protein CPR30-like [Tarenaya hassleriana]